MPITNLDNLSTAENFSDIIGFLNQNTEGLFMAMFVFSFSMILILILARRMEALKAIWVSSGITTLLCFLFLLANFINWYVFVVYLLITVVITFFIYLGVD
jgi:hypothetical protein